MAKPLILILEWLPDGVLTRLAARLQVAPEDALRTAIFRFEDRFRAMEDLVAADGRTMQELNLEEMDVYWQQVKRNQREGALPKK